MVAAQPPNGELSKTSPKAFAASHPVVSTCAPIFFPSSEGAVALCSLRTTDRMRATTPPEVLENVRFQNRKDFSNRSF